MRWERQRSPLVSPTRLEHISGSIYNLKKVKRWKCPLSQGLKLCEWTSLETFFSSFWRNLVHFATWLTRTYCTHMHTHTCTVTLVQQRLTLPMTDFTGKKQKLYTYTVFDWGNRTDSELTKVLRSEFKWFPPLLCYNVSSRSWCHWDKLSAGGNRARPEGGDISKGKLPPRVDPQLYVMQAKKRGGRIWRVAVKPQREFLLFWWCSGK